jgi:K+-sensing histidine kinase KdpD
MARIDVGEVSETPDHAAPADAPRHPSGDARGGHLGFVAHEIRNPLSTALWTAELLARMPATERGGARGDKLSAMCLRSIARVRQLVEDHLLTERLDVGGIPLRTESLGLAETVAAVLERRAPDAPAVAVDLDATLGVESDRSLLERVLETLIAVAGAEGTAVKVSAAVAGDEVVVVVGGKPADAAALADPVKGSPSDPTGRALALPLARRIAAALGGTLAAGEAGWRLSLSRARAYTPRPSPVARP